jgi:hypothetical protein
MIFLTSIILGISIAINIIFVWYTRKLVQNLYYGVNNVDELQKLLNEYIALLQPLLQMENYYGDPVLASAITNTKIVIDACSVYKNSIIESENEEIQEKEDFFNEKEEVKERKATITKI